MSDSPDRAAKLAECRKMADAAKAIMGEGMWEVHPHLCELLDTLLAIIDEMAQEIARLDTYRVQLCDCGSPVRQCTECAVGDYQAAAITTALIAKDEQMGANARLGAALKPHLETILGALREIGENYSKPELALEVLRALAPLIEQEEEGDDMPPLCKWCEHVVTGSVCSACGGPQAPLIEQASSEVPRV